MSTAASASRAEVARRLISLTDLTSLNESDDAASVHALSMLARTAPVKPAAVCIWARWIPAALDALRGTGRNLAVANGTDRFNRQITSNTATYQLKIRKGILSDCGTIIGRVFIDKNFDGEQQPGEPGVPNAVIYLDDGNRITTDANGLYSLNFVLPGTHTGTLDLTSLIAGLQAKGHTVSNAAQSSGVSSIMRINRNGVPKLEGGVDPRREGIVLGDGALSSQPARMPFGHACSGAAERHCS